MRVIGTAGHVDHGKSTLVQALTGINPDRLREEQERQMTIDLGFAWLDLPGGEEIGIIDVPGHRDFIENMLAGVGGIDAALFVIAADEGVMPQSREHLAILDLLEINSGVIAVTKADMVQDREWLALVEDEVRALVQNTTLEGAPIMFVSGKTGQGLEELKEAIGAVLEQTPQRRDIGRPRLPVDRVFSIAGFGTVVTGTLSDGSLQVGDQIEILPQRLKGRVRGLQTHKVKLERAVPGSRAAVNLSGVEVEDIQRGDVVAYPGSYQPTSLIDVSFRLVPDADAPLVHNQEVKLFLGAAQRMARVRLLGAEALKPGQEGWLQLVLEAPIIAARGDHYILRRPSPPATLGGGRVADAHPDRRHRRMNPEIPARLEQSLRGTPGQVLLQALIRSGPQSIVDLVKASGLNVSQAQEGLEELANDQLVAFMAGDKLATDSESILADLGWLNRMQEKTTSVLAEYHKQWPLRRGMPKEELKSRLALDQRAYQGLLRYLASNRILKDEGVYVLLADHAPALNPKQEKLVEEWLSRFRQSPYAPPSVKESLEKLGSELYQHLVDSGQLKQVSSEVVFLSGSYESMVEEVRRSIQESGGVTVAEVRDMFQTSRKYVLGLLEHLDEIGLTVREGDVRRLGQPK